jgi:aldose 1-epimerase
MSFDIQIQDQPFGKSIQLIDPLANTMVTLFSKGALMNSWKINKNDPATEIIHGNAMPSYLEVNLKEESFEMNGFRSGKMSPFSCRIQEGQYEWEGQYLRFNKFYLGKHAMHGLIYDAVFEIQSTEQSSDHAMVSFVYDYLGTDPGFPFPYSIQVQWTLFRQHRIGVKTRVLNHSNFPIPMMDGWHPYFTLGGKVNDYDLKFNPIGQIEMDQEMIPTGQLTEMKAFEKGKKIGATHFDDCFLLGPMHPTVSIQYNEKLIQVHSIHNYPYMQLYTPEDRKSIAIENLSGAPDCFNNKMGLQLLEPHDEIYFETTYQFSATASYNGTN